MEDINEKMASIWKGFVYQVQNTKITSITEAEKMLKDASLRVDISLRDKFRENGKKFLSEWVKNYFIS